MAARGLLVLGGSGTLGGPLSMLAAARGWDVIATYFTHPDGVRAGLPVQLDLRDKNALRDLVAATQPDVIVHTAVTERSGEGFAEAIRLSAEHVAALAAAHRARLIALSTDLVFDGTETIYTEDSLVRPCTDNAYAVAKVEYERIIRAVYPAALVVRTSLIYDFEPENAQVAWMLRGIERGETLRLFTDQMRCPIWAANLAEALLELAEMDAMGLLHLVGPALMSRYDLGVGLLVAMDYDPAAHVEAASAPDTAPKSLHLSVARAQALLTRTRLLTLDEASSSRPT